MALDPTVTEAALSSAAAEGVQSYTSDGETITAPSIKEQIELDKYAKAISAASGSNSNGGPRSMWGRLRTARAIPQGFGT